MRLPRTRELEEVQQVVNFLQVEGGRCFPGKVRQLLRRRKLPPALLPCPRLKANLLFQSQPRVARLIPEPCRFERAVVKNPAWLKAGAIAASNEGNSFLVAKDPVLVNGANLHVLTEKLVNKKLGWNKKTNGWVLMRPFCIALSHSLSELILNFTCQAFDTQSVLLASQ